MLDGGSGEEMSMALTSLLKMNDKGPRHSAPKVQEVFPEVVVVRREDGECPGSWELTSLDAK